MGLGLDSSYAGTEDYDLAEPRAASLIQSLRAFGYDLPTAVADLIDNSVSAGAKNIWLDFHWAGHTSSVSILDDGQGMDEETLVAAMRLGSRSPLEPRDPKDLGRFGLGLKTASFSQCRQLTVGSRWAGGPISVRRWDLDYVTSAGEWRLLRSGSEGFQRAAGPLADMRSGTIVLWEKMDRVCASADVNCDADHALFLAHIQAVRQHVAMVFHRFLEAPAALRLWVNDQAVRPWDPFLTKEPATQLLADEAVALFGARMTVRPYVLPHHSKTSAAIYAAAAGPRGWNAQQGFYVYRNRRLLVAGDWLGLGFQKAEHYKLARIQLDIPNSMDAEWEIDVRKARATPPPTVRRDLRRLATLTRNRASDVYRHRGARLSQGLVEQVLLWERRVHHDQISYALNREHPLVRAVLDGSPEENRRVRALLSVIEETVPVPTIAQDAAESPDRHAKPFTQAPPAVLQHALEETYYALRAAGYDHGQALARLMNTEPFSLFPERVAALGEQENRTP